MKGSHKGKSFRVRVCLSMFHISGSADLQAERGRASFDIGKMIDFVTGGPEETAYRKKVLLQFERDPTFRIDDYYDLTKDEQRERVMTRVS